MLSRQEHEHQETEVHDDEEEEDEKNRHTFIENVELDNFMGSAYFSL
jgi:hypothetical protein